MPGNKMGFDEDTARYNGRMIKLKHRQSRYKPYDGIRIYMLNDSQTGKHLFIVFILFCLHVLGCVYMCLLVVCWLIVC